LVDGFFILVLEYLEVGIDEFKYNFTNSEATN